MFFICIRFLHIIINVGLLLSLIIQVIMIFRISANVLLVIIPDYLFFFPIGPLRRFMKLNLRQLLVQLIDPVGFQRLPALLPPGHNGLPPPPTPTSLLRRVHGRLPRRANPDERALRLCCANLIPPFPAQHGLLQRSLSPQHDLLGHIGGEARDEVRELLLQSQYQALVARIGRVELEHLVEETANRRLLRYAVVLHVERVEAVIVPQRGRERPRPLHADAIIPEAERDERGVPPREGRRQRRRALGTDVVLPQE
mmetsp:Transcript_7088/g.17583  ORF Transcript_7088/g.17583 Transcript_7088/m.17583 type:complete len:255 (+) Transcript_7088:428-1192(+)